MNKYFIHRDDSTDQGTPGVLSGVGIKLFSLELPWRNNQRKRSCIPTGVYRCQIVQSPRFGQVFRVWGVEPARDHVLIHPANFAGDDELGWCKQLEGCITFGLRMGQMRNPAGNMQLAVMVSRPAVQKFMAHTKLQPFELEITC